MSQTVGACKPLPHSLSCVTMAGGIFMARPEEAPEQDVRDFLVMAEHTPDAHEVGRRDFLSVATIGVTAVGAGFAAWPLIAQWNPAADVLALASIEVDLSPVAEGQQITVNWRGKPVFIRHRTADEIAAARDVAMDDLKDPQPDSERALRPEWLHHGGSVVLTSGAFPWATRANTTAGSAPVHGSHYDTSGRIRKGPAPENLGIPDYVFTDDTTVVIG